MVAEQHASWMGLWNSWPTREVFAHPEYVKLFCRESDQALCAVWRGEQGGILFPFIRRPLNIEKWSGEAPDLSDLIGPYGYGGPYCWGQVDSSRYWALFIEWATQSGIVSLFTRLSLFPEQLLPFYGLVEVNAPNIVRALNAKPEDIWMQYEHKVRKNVKRAEAEGVIVEQEDSGLKLDEFLAVYFSTMKRRNADKGYCFPREFFLDIVHNLPGLYVFFHAIRGGRIISSELVLVSVRNIYSFLGGTLAEAFKCRPNDLIKHRIIQWGIKTGKEAFVLGGGFGAPDGIYRYKHSFAPDGVRPFFVGKWILSESLYAEMVDYRMKYESRKDKQWAPRADYFPAYRG